MSRWLVSQGDRQFAAKDLDELKSLAKSGKLAATDMIQPPGAADWLYASEIPDLKGSFTSNRSTMLDDVDAPSAPSALRTPVMILFGLITLGAAYVGYDFYKQIPTHDQLDLLGDGGLAMTQLLVTFPDAPVLSKPDGDTVGTLTKDSTLDMLGKRGVWYHIQSADGVKGYVKNDHVIPGYLFGGKEAREDFDPLYNPDRYVFVENSSWLQLDQRKSNLTVFQFLLQNKSKFVMTDVILKATIKDKNDKVLDTVEIPIEGVVPRHEAVMVGTLAPPDNDKKAPKRLMTSQLFKELAKEDEELNLRWSEGVEIEMKVKGFAEAEIDILEVRAVPNDEATK
jgi:hypothetical protein